MKVKVKKQEANNISFAAKLSEAIYSIGSMSYTDKNKLYDKVIEICREHVGDCSDALIMAYYIALHDVYGFGAQRLAKINEAVQPIIDDTVNRYDIATVYKLRSKLRERGFEYVLHCEQK